MRSATYLQFFEFWSLSKIHQNVRFQRYKHCNKHSTAEWICFKNILVEVHK